jgi:hypothetical protein
MQQHQRLLSLLILILLLTLLLIHLELLLSLHTYNRTTAVYSLLIAETTDLRRALR